LTDSVASADVSEVKLDGDYYCKRIDDLVRLSELDMSFGADDNNRYGIDYQDLALNIFELDRMNIINSGFDTLKHAYRKLSLKTHPDKFKPDKRVLATEVFKYVGLAFEILKESYTFLESNKTKTATDDSKPRKKKQKTGGAENLGNREKKRKEREEIYRQFKGYKNTVNDLMPFFLETFDNICLHPQKKDLATFAYFSFIGRVASNDLMLILEGDDDNQICNAELTYSFSADVSASICLVGSRTSNGLNPDSFHPIVLELTYNSQKRSTSIQYRLSLAPKIFDWFEEEEQWDIFMPLISRKIFTTNRTEIKDEIPLYDLAFVWLVQTGLAVLSGSHILYIKHKQDDPVFSHFFLEGRMGLVFRTVFKICRTRTELPTKAFDAILEHLPWCDDNATAYGAHAAIQLSKWWLNENINNRTIEGALVPRRFATGITVNYEEKKMLDKRNLEYAKEQQRRDIVSCTL